MSKLEPCERELVLRIADDEDRFTITSSSPAWTARLMRLVQRLGFDGCEVEGWGGAIVRVTVPRDRLNPLTLVRKMELTPDQRAERSKRALKSLHSVHKSGGENLG